ncbi:MAG: O-antigen ligase family protein [Pleurocapsa minor GSE-CHR-MK-17-07R]|nr:O-antigen ligase family protein [Pleurocapsa minor GSE-CHR-MK 17-07R]
MKAITFPRPMPSLQPLVFTSAAVGIALLIAAFPSDTVILVLGGLALLVCIFATPLAAAAALLVLAPLRALVLTESAINLPVDIGQLMFALFLGVWLLHRIVLRRTLLNWRHSPVFACVLIFFAAGTLSLFSALSVSAWLIEWLKWLQILIIITLCLDMAVARAWWWLVFALMLAGIANFLVGLYQFLGGSGALHLLIEGRFFRAFGTFGQPNPFGGMMGLLAPLAFGAALGSGIKLIRLLQRTGKVSLTHTLATLFFLACTVMFPAGVLISWSRGSWLGLAAGLAAVVFALPGRFRHSLAILFVLAASALILWTTGLLPASITDRLGSAFTDTFSASDVRGVDITTENYAVVERLAHWQAALLMAESHPFTGVGLGGYEDAYPTYRLINWKFPLGHAHNFYLNVFAETGIIGLVGYLAMWGGILVLTWRARSHPDISARGIVIGLFGAWTYFSVHSLTDNLLVNNLFLHLGFQLGLLAILFRQTHAGIPFLRHR